MKCYFCETGDSITPVQKVKIAGKNMGKRKQKTCGICLTCSAMSDNLWIAEQLGWDEVTGIRFKEEKR